MSSRLAHAVAAAATAVLGAAMLLPVTVVEAAPVALDSYGASAESWGVDVRAVPVAQREEVPDLADEYLPHTRAAVDSLPHAVADGEFLDPGALVRTGPGLVDGSVLVPHGLPPAVPAFPYVAQTTSDASSPRDVETGITHPYTPEPEVLPVTVPGAPAAAAFAGSCRAHADASPYARAGAALGALDLGGITVATVTGESSAREVDGVVTATTTTTMSGIAIAGTLRIAAMTLTASVETSGPGTVRTAQRLEYAGVTVAGVPASIDEKGLHVGAAGVPADRAQQAIAQLDQALAQHGARLVGPRAEAASTPDGGGTVGVDGLSLVAGDAQNLEVTVSLGRAQISARALRTLGLPFGGAVPPPVAPAAPLPEPAVPITAVVAPSAATPGPPVRRGTVRQRSVPAVLAGHRRRLLVLPFVAVATELSLVLLVIQAYRWQREPRADPEELLAL